MMHLLRILLIGLTVICVTSQTLQPRAAAPGSLDGCSYQQRREALAGQLEQLRNSTGTPNAAVPVEHKTLAVITAEHRRQKETLLANSLAGLILRQAAASPERSRNEYVAIEGPALTLVPPASGNFSAPQQTVAFLQTDDESSDAPETTESDDSPVADADDVVPPPMPPAPRVQATDEVHESQESLVRQFRGLIRAVSAGADPADVGTQKIETPDFYSTSDTPDMSDTPDIFDAPIDTPMVTEGEFISDVSARPAPIRPLVAYDGDPLDQLVDVDFRDFPLTHVIPAWALKAGINIIAGADLSGTVTADMRQVPLRVALETVLRMNGLGLIEEDGIYFVVPYTEAASVNRETVTVALQKTDATEVQRILQDIVSGIRDEAVISISSNKQSNSVVISAPRKRVDELVTLAHQLDTAEQVLPTVTESIMLNYSEPQRMLPLLKSMLTPKIGEVAADDRARQIVVTDMPVVVEQVRDIVKKLDIATKQVLIETMVVDAVLNDEADTGVQWLLESVRRMSRRQAALGADGRAVGNLQELSLLSNLQALQAPGGLLNFGVLTGNIDWRGLIQMEVRNRNAHLVSNPVLLTLENEQAQISISQEIPYIELKETGAGGSQTTTSFKDVGTILSVTPRVTHDNTIITTIEAKESNLFGQFQGVPIEDKREIQSTMRMANGQTVFVGGLRKSNASSTAKKIPVLGDVPVINFMFRTNQRTEQINELLVFLTCSVLESEHPDELTPYQREILDKAPPIVPRVDAWETVMYETVHPDVSKEFQKTWRRGT